MAVLFEFFRRLFLSDFIPQGQGFFWQPGIPWLNAISDSLMALAYFSLSVTFIYLVRKPLALRINGLLAMFGVFIVACGATHAMAVWDVWHGAGRLEGLIKAITAVLSVATAIACVRLAPAARKTAGFESLARTTEPDSAESSGVSGGLEGRAGPVRAPEKFARANAALQAEIEVRKETESKLQALLTARSLEGKARMRWFVDTVSDAILLVSGDGKIQLANRRAEEMFGYSRGELRGEELEILLPERYRVAHAGHRAEYLAAPRVRAMGVRRDLTGRRKDGSEFPVEIGLNYVEVGEGKLAMGLVRDLTEGRHAESELARVNAELRRSTIELGQFAYVASHDLQEPLRMITGYLQLLERRYKDKINIEASEFIEYAVEGAWRMKRLIEDLLALSHAGTQATNFGPVESRDLFEAACANLAASIGESGAEITADPLPGIVADVGLLTQVFENLIGNAIKFRAKGSRPRIHVSAERSKGSWVFSVRDHGLGIEPQHVERIFGIFERLHSADEYEGSGVGLAITQRILERHDGRIWVESKPGEGSTFFFVIPAQFNTQGEKRAGAGGS